MSDTKIRTKSFNYGHENESTWPPMFGDGKPGLYHFDEATGECLEGPPPKKDVKHGVAPMYISDCIEPYYHPGACKWTDSRAKLNKFDRDFNCITTDKQIKADEGRRDRLRRERQKDLTECLRKSVAAIDNGMSPLSEEVRAKCDRTNEIVSQALNIDAFNVVGRKKNEKGNRFKRFRR